MENILFKQSFRGFDRNQVLEYIDDLSDQMSRQAENYTEIQKGLEEEIRTLTDKLSQTGENLNISKEKVQELSRNLAGLRQDNIELKKQVNTYRNMILERDRGAVRLIQGKGIVLLEVLLQILLVEFSCHNRILLIC